MKKIVTGPMQFTSYRPWSDERKADARDRGIANAERLILAHLAKGGAFAAKDICGDLFYRTGGAHTWEALLRLERAGLVWRAFDYEDWKTMHLWKITGCGLLAARPRS